MPFTIWIDIKSLLLLIIGTTTFSLLLTVLEVERDCVSTAATNSDVGHWYRIDIRTASALSSTGQSSNSSCARSEQPPST
jgi:hypothetical protein